MYQIIQPIHSYLAYVTLALLLWAVINGIMGSSSEKIFEESHLKVNKFALIATHTMFLLGLILLFTSPLGYLSNSMKDIMKDSQLRLQVVEHPFVNILAVILITIGNARVKRSVGNGRKFKHTLIFFGLGLVLILSRLPWGVWFD